MSFERAALAGRELPSASLAPPPIRRAGFALPQWLASAAVYGLFALALRGVYWGNPAVHIDEQFYLLVADRMAQGALPYVDIWDRKPIGLFLIYWAARALWGDGVLAYQIMAWASVTATAVIVHRLARMIAAPRGAWLAGIAYLLFLMIFNCAGGQSPVFYNLLVACGALLLVHVSGEERHPRLARRGIVLMLLIGLAMQIKYTVVFEGVAFGCALLARAWADGASLTRLRALAALWIGCAVLPTALVWAWYIFLGHGLAFAQANFLSVFQRAPFLDRALWRLFKELLVLTPFWLAIFRAPRAAVPDEGENPQARRVLLFWAAGAVGGFLLFGTWYDHYVAPMLPPLAVISAPAFGRPGNGIRQAALMLAVGLIGGLAVTEHNLRQLGNAADIQRASELIRTHLHGGCLYVFEAEPVLYRTTNSCLPSRFVFPSHLSSLNEAKALGVKPEVELATIFHKAPAVVVMGDRPVSKPANLATRRQVRSHLEADYVLIAIIPIGTIKFDVYQRRDLARLEPLSFSSPKKAWRFGNMPAQTS